MKLEFEQIDIETSKKFAAESFGLGDPRVIQELLSSKIYSRPKYIIVQEVSCNARDANREAGRADMPIQIKLPNRLDDNLIIADNGPGISPDRMSNVFLLYGNSTKRSDDKLTGGFGIGAKTPFTYTDTFTIVTVTDDEDGRHKRTYIAYKESGGFAKMSLASTEDTKEGTGTAISFVVERKDYSDFERAVREVCKFWKVKPEIRGSAGWTWHEPKIILSGPNWELHEGGDAAVILVDRIPYSARIDSIFKDEHDKMRKVFSRLPLRLFFNVGDISVSATREDLDYTDKTIASIKDILTGVISELQKKVNASIASETSLMHASAKWRNESHSFRGFVVEPMWNGKALFPNAWAPNTYTSPAKFFKWYKGSAADVNPSSFAKISNFVNQGDKITIKKSYGRYDRSIHFDFETVVVIDDIKRARPNRLRMLTLFERFPKAQRLCVVEFNDEANALACFRDAFAWDDVPTVLLSTIPKLKRAMTKRGSYTVNAVKELKDDGNSASYVKKWLPNTGRSPEDTLGGTYVILKNGKPVNKAGIVIPSGRIDMAGSILKTPVYGILYKYRNKVSSSWSHLDDELIRVQAELSALPTVKTHIRLGDKYFQTVFDSAVETLLKSRLSEIKDKRIAKVLGESKLSSECSDDYRRYKDVCNALFVSVPALGTSLSASLTDIEAAYPMARHFGNMLSHYRWSTESKSKKSTEDEIIFYMNAKFEQTTQGATNANP